MTGPDSPAWLLRVWRQVARHHDLGELLAALGPDLRVGGEPLPLAILQVDPVKGHVRCAGVVGPPLIDALRRGNVDDERLAGALHRAPANGDTFPARRLAALYADPDRALPLFLRPLPTSGPGLAVLATSRARTGPVEDAVAALAEPLACALENDRRMHDLARLREAAEAENRSLRTRLARDDISETIVGATSGLSEVLRQVDQVAPTDAPVLILGETGSGKEVVARAIHARSSRRDGPFVRVNCGAIPQELIDSELFGHERGSFTGAIATRQGWFERANGGTLFLDEVGELSAAAQVRLLRVLQDGTFERVGAQTTLQADVRVLAATHRDVRAMVADGSFREDLWYRVSVFPIRLPALRERPEDIPALAAHFAARAGLRLHGVALTPSRADVASLVRYGWPGNVRELAAVIERAAILGDGERLDVDRALGGAVAAPAERPVRAATAERFDDIQRRAIEEALLACEGRIEGPRGAAARLGVKPSTLRSRMKRLGVRAAG
jgi:transcriptional regulator with GAF, ATPase, and Fis domain